MKKYSEVNYCPVTGDDYKVSYFDLGMIPLVNNLYNTREDSINCERFPLKVNYFNSGESALSIAIDGQYMFSHYLYKSEVNKPYYKHCQDMFAFCKNYLDFNDSSIIIDIGGNDGTLLNAFRSINDKPYLLNIDASKNLTDICLSKGIDVINDFFSYDLAKSLKFKADLITSTNVFQHLLDINSFVKGIKFLLKENGLWVLEFPYWINSMETNQFDQVYHEHIYYHSIKPIKSLIENNGLKIINVSSQNIHGGTLRVTICNEESSFIPDNTLEYFLNYEDKFDLEYHINWGISVKKHINDSYGFIKDLINSGKKIYGFGAAAKGCIYLNAMGLDYNDIGYIIDDTDIKQGKYVPGTGMEIVSRDILKENQPDYILILAHNFSEYIINSLKDQFSGKYIVLLPKIKILDYDFYNNASQK